MRIKNFSPFTLGNIRIERLNKCKDNDVHALPFISTALSNETKYLPCQ